MPETQYLADLIGWGDEIDILPYAEAVVIECPYEHDLTARELAELAVADSRGKYISVQVQDRVAGRMLGSMTRQLIGRVRFEHQRRAQLLDPDLRKALPSLELIADLDICSHAAEKTGRFLDAGELEAIPLPGCWTDSCFCEYRLSKDQAPQPPASANCSGIVEVENDDCEQEEE